VAIAVAEAVETDLPELADVAARTFPLACPPASTPENIAAFIDENLSQARFRDYLSDPDRAVLCARDDGRIAGYAMLIRGVPDDEDVQQAVALRPAVELSKIYVLPGYHGGGASSALMDLTLATAEERGARRVWLGVNQGNERAQRFYTKNGFRISGTRTFQLGSDLEHDYVMVRELG